jgi:hypothetical protein
MDDFLPLHKKKKSDNPLLKLLQDIKSSFNLSGNDNTSKHYSALGSKQQLPNSIQKHGV